MEAARRARADDLDAIATLGQAARAHMVAFRGGELFLRREARRDVPPMASLLDHAQWAVFVGTLDDVVVGFAVVEREELDDGGILAVIHEIFVEEGARGVAVGELMMDEVLAWCRAEGCEAVDAIALPGDRNTKNFFERSGFTARLLRMHHKLT